MSWKIAFWFVATFNALNSLYWLYSFRQLRQMLGRAHDHNRLLDANLALAHGQVAYLLRKVGPMMPSERQEMFDLVTKDKP